MDLFAEDLHPRLREVFQEFDNYCKEHNVFYSIASDEANKQGYLIKKDTEGVDNLVDYVQGPIERNQVHLNIDSENEAGTLLTFTLESVQDVEEGAGHWDVVKGHPGKMGGADKKGYRGQYTIFAKPEDAKKVRAGKMPIQRLGNIKAKKATFEEKLQRALEEDQYKSPTGKHRRGQSMYPSSFGRSRTFGGVTNGPRRKKTKKEGFERNLDLIFGEDLEVTELESLKELWNLMVQYEDIMTGEPVGGDPEQIWQEILTKFDGFKNSAFSDDARNISSEFFDAVSDWTPDKKFGSDGSQNWHIESDKLEDIMHRMTGLQNMHQYGQEVGPTLDQEIEMEQGLSPTKPNMRPIGLFGPGDKRQPEGTPRSSGRNKLLRMGERGQLGNI